MLQIDNQDLKTLKEKLPADWVKRIQCKVNFGGTKIRETLKAPENYDSEIIDAAIKVAAEYETEKRDKILEQKEGIKTLRNYETI